MAGSNPSKHVSFEEPPSSASDEDRTPVEVLFDSSNPYRRKSSLVTNDAVPPHLHRAPAPPHTKTECLVHQFLASQKKEKPVIAPKHQSRSCEAEAEDVSFENGLHRPLDPKGKNGHAPQAQFKSEIAQPDDKGHEREQEQVEKEEQAHPSATFLRHARTAISAKKAAAQAERQHPEAGTDDDAAGGSSSSSSSASTTTGQSDEKQWRREMVANDTLPRTPSQLDRHFASPDALNSRLLTKKQLSEMAWGVRELSRRLGSMRLKFRAKSIMLLTKIYDAELITRTRELCRWLMDRERDVRYTVYVDKELRDNKRFDAAGLVEEVRRDYVASGEVTEEASWDVGKRLRYWDEEVCRTRPHTFDFVITLGGDGTVLYASWLFQRIVPPVLSFALGSLGFLTKFDFEDYRKTLTSAFNEGVTVSLRLRFEATIMRSRKTGSRIMEDGEHAQSDLDGDGSGPPRDLVEELIGEEKDDEHTHRPDGTYEVLNEVVVDRGPNPSMPLPYSCPHI
ncbi:ATP-NAD kinase [Parathielavia hyrcaniae]|uniref:ATP-NAD kinase n=1 Tax=Parathielavia hyrcaniae TaxID=113614 RepID=A0AAN6Q5F7_9PEZI|nr:ATP-NAD kinase [Parathielavia hyrcaniae]